MAWTIKGVGSWGEATSDSPATDMAAGMALPQSYRWHVRANTILVRRDQWDNILAPAGPPVAGFTAWYDAASLAATVTDGSPLGTWPDLSGNTWHAVSPGGSQRPTFYSSTAGKLVNGKPAVWFGGGGTHTMNTAGNPPPPKTLIAVVGVQSLADPADTLVACGWEVRSDSGKVQLVNPGQSVFLTSNVAPPLVPSFYAGTYDGTNAAVYINSGTPDNTSTSSTSVTYGSLYLGCLGFAGVQAFNGPLCEIVVYPNVLTGPQIASTYSYLKSKWGTP